jgi:hypothetical protein
MATAQQSIRRFPSQRGAPGVAILEKPGLQAFSDPRYGTTAMYGWLKRGPMGAAIPLTSKTQYSKIFGDPKDPNWHLFKDSSHLMPDAIDGFYSNGGGSGQLWITRLDLDGTARKAEVIIRNRQGDPALKILAANEGAWGGNKNETPENPVIFATPRTFTLIAPGVLANEFAGGIAQFTNSYKQYNIVANTKANNSGEVVFTVSPQFNLLVDGISGPTTIGGYASYDRRTALSGTVSYSLLKDITGICSVAGAVVTGTGTVFVSELQVGDQLYYGGELRVVTSITSDTTLTINSPYTNDNQIGVTLQVNNKGVTGLGTAFDTELAVGDVVYASIAGELVARTVASISSATAMELTSGFEASLLGSTLEKDNYIVTGYNPYLSLSGTVSYSAQVGLTGTVDLDGTTTILGTGTAFNAELNVGDTLYYGAESRTVAAIVSATEITLSSAFTPIITGATINKASLTVTGVGTAFASELSPGETIYVSIGGSLEGKIIGSIASNTSLTLATGFTQDVTGVSAYASNPVSGTPTTFLSDLQVGQYIIDPNRAGSTVLVASVLNDYEFVVSKPFAYGFANAQLTKQNQKGKVQIIPTGTEGLSVEVGQGTKYPATHFSLKINFNGSRVLDIPDASLDPNDPLFVEQVVDEANVAYRTGSVNYHSYVTAEVLWFGSYTTNEETDVRPANGSDVVLATEDNILYTVANFDYASAIGNSLFPSPYELPRSFLRILDAKAPLTLEGDVNSLGTFVSGVGTTFKSELSVGDYIYDPNSKTARKVVGILTDTELNVDRPFPVNITPGTKIKRCGSIEVSQTYDLSALTSVGTHFLVSYPEYLTKGYDGNPAQLVPWYFTKFFDQDFNHLESATLGRNQGLIKILCPGISDVTVQRSAALYAESKAYEFRGEIPSFLQTAASAESFLNQELIRNDFMICAFPSYGYIASQFGAGSRFVSLSGDIVGGEAKLANAVGGYHFPYAGVKAQLPRILKLPFETTLAEEVILTEAGLQTVKTVSGVPTVWGARGTAQSALYDFNHIRRIQSNLIRIFVEAQTLLDVLFLPNQPNLAESIIMVLDNFARREYKKGVFTQYLSFTEAVTISNLDAGGGDDNSSIVAIINGQLNILFRYVPTGIVETLAIHLGPDVLVANFGQSLSTGN